MEVGAEVGVGFSVGNFSEIKKKQLSKSDGRMRGGAWAKAHAEEPAMASRD